MNGVQSFGNFRAHSNDERCEMREIDSVAMAVSVHQSAYAFRFAFFGISAATASMMMGAVRSTNGTIHFSTDTDWLIRFHHFVARWMWWSQQAIDCGLYIENNSFWFDCVRPPSAGCRPKHFTCFVHRNNWRCQREVNRLGFDGTNGPTDRQHTNRLHWISTTENDSHHLMMARAWATMETQTFDQTLCIDFNLRRVYSYRGARGSADAIIHFGQKENRTMANGDENESNLKFKHVTSWQMELNTMLQSHWRRQRIAVDGGDNNFDGSIQECWTRFVSLPKLNRNSDTFNTDAAMGNCKIRFYASSVPRIVSHARIVWDHIRAVAGSCRHPIRGTCCNSHKQQKSKSISNIDTRVPVHMKRCNWIQLMLNVYVPSLSHFLQSKIIGCRVVVSGVWIGTDHVLVHSCVCVWRQLPHIFWPNRLMAAFSSN